MLVNIVPRVAVCGGILRRRMSAASTVAQCSNLLCTCRIHSSATLSTQKLRNGCQSCLQTCLQTCRGIRTLLGSGWPRFALALAFGFALARGFVGPTQPCVEPRLAVRRVLAPVAALAVELPRALPSTMVHTRSVRYTQARCTSTRHILHGDNCTAPREQRARDARKTRAQGQFAVCESRKRKSQIT